MGRFDFLTVGGVKILAKFGKNPAGRYGFRLSRGITTHIAGQAAVRGLRRSLPKAYESLSKDDKWIADQIVELSVRITANIAQQNIEVYVSNQEIDAQAEQASINLSEAVIQGINSRALSLGYDSVFGKIDRSGRLFVQKDLIKQAILSCIGEIFNAHVEETS